MKKSRIPTEKRISQGEEPSDNEIIVYMRQHRLSFYQARETLREKAYGGKPPHGFTCWGDYWKYR